MQHDGNGWVRCDLGHRHWGRHGAAGLLLVDRRTPADRSARVEPLVLLQHRAAWTHQGDTWAVPGGAMDAHEDPFTAALREAAEETSLRPQDVEHLDEWVDNHGTWRYTTIIVLGSPHLQVRSTNPESNEMRWWAFADVPGLDLHPGFAAAWPQLHVRIVDRLGLP